LKPIDMRCCWAAMSLSKNRRIEINTLLKGVNDIQKVSNVYSGSLDPRFTLHVVWPVKTLE